MLMSLETIQLVWVGLLGLAVGSFLNVVIFRLPREISVVRPRSQCAECKNPVAWKDNLPIVSFFLLKGKCRNCGSKISWRYPLVELLTSLLFMTALVKFGLQPSTFLRAFPFLSILIAVTFIDLDHRIIPDELSLGGWAWGLITAFEVVGGEGLLPAIIGSIGGFCFFYGFAWVYWRFTGRSGLGGGDIKLLGMLGAFIGLPGVFTTILVSSVIGSVIGIAWAKFKSEGDVLKAAIPYGPFLVIGALYHFLVGDLLWHPFMSLM